MAYTASVTARNAENDHYNVPGMCLQQCRSWAGIAALYPTASRAWAAIPSSKKSTGRTPPRGAAVYWTGGSRGYGHIAISLGGGKIRSTDSGGQGRVATVPVSWVETHWGHRYAGWSWYINNSRIQSPTSPPPPPPPEDDMPLNDADKRWLRAAIRDETKKVVASYHEESVKDGTETIWISTALTRALARLKRIEAATGSRTARTARTAKRTAKKT